MAMAAALPAAKVSDVRLGGSGTRTEMTWAVNRGVRSPEVIHV